MKTLYTLLLLFIFSLASGQNTKYTFAKDVFKKEYKEQTYEPYKGKATIVDSMTIKYGEQVLFIPKLDDKYKRIFTSHAGIFASNEIAESKTEKEIATMTEGQRFIYFLGRNDTIRILYFDELEDLNQNAKTKRFVFWISNNYMMNPTECYFELKNDNATKRTPLSEFIAGARLTFFYRGTIIL